MNNLEKLEKVAADAGLHVDYFTFSSSRLEGLLCDNSIAINNNIRTTARKADILAEELGHYYTSAGNILDQSKVENRKQERKAREWAYRHRIDFAAIIKAYEKGYKTTAEIAEYLDVSEEFLIEALEFFRQKYGTSFVPVGNYCLQFEPTLRIHTVQLFN